MKFTFCKKQYIYLALAIVSACIALTTHVFAQEPFEPGQQEGRPEGSAMNEEQQENVRGTISEKVRDRVTNLGDNLHTITSAVIERMTNIADRIDTRIAKIKSMGIDVAAAEAEVARARADLQGAQRELDGTMTALRGATANPQSAFMNARNQFISTHQAITSAQMHLRTAVATLKESVRAGVTTQPVVDSTNSTESTPVNSGN